MKLDQVKFVQARIEQCKRIRRVLDFDLSPHLPEETRLAAAARICETEIESRRLQLQEVPVRTRKWANAEEARALATMSGTSEYSAAAALAWLGRARLAGSTNPSTRIQFSPSRRIGPGRGTAGEKPEQPRLMDREKGNQQRAMSQRKRAIISALFDVVEEAAALRSDASKRFEFGPVDGPEIPRDKISRLRQMIDFIEEQYQEADASKD